MTQEQQEQQQGVPYTRPARTTKASWPTEIFVTTDDDDHYMCAAFLDTGEGLDWAERFSACWNSYARHFGPRAVEAAEEDLLGQALEALQWIADVIGTSNPNDWTDAEAETAIIENTALAILAKRDAATTGHSPSREG